jgi:hypothetical protein
MADSIDWSNLGEVSRELGLEQAPVKGSKGFKATDDLPWEMIGGIRADGVWFPVLDSAWANELFKIALARDLASVGAIENGDPQRIYPVLIKRSKADDGGDVIHHILISFDSGELDYSNLDEGVSGSAT